MGLNNIDKRPVAFSRRGALHGATASVDLDNERYIQEAITELVKGKKLLVIAHRLNTICTADRIVVVSGGTVGERARTPN